MNTVFYSWQSDRPGAVCRNFIERALQSAIDRLRADVEIDPSLRMDLELDRDTKNTPGSPAIFDTILSKIKMARVVVCDLTFVCRREDGRPIPNPNVLIECGYALNRPGSTRIVSAMNEAYGKASNQSLPFNLAHIRFPIRYSLRENASEDEKKAARKLLTDALESALRTIFTSKEYQAEEAKRVSSALDVADIHKREKEYSYRLSALGYGDGLEEVNRSVETLFGLICAKCNEVESKHNFDMECGFQIIPRERTQACVLKTPYLGIVVNWEQPLISSLDRANLNVVELSGPLYLPGTFPGGAYFPPKELDRKIYQPTLSDSMEIGWVKHSKTIRQSPFISNEEFAEGCVTQLVNMLRKGAR
jgi:hypothetical protein